MNAWRVEKRQSSVIVFCPELQNYLMPARAVIHTNNRITDQVQVLRKWNIKCLTTSEVSPKLLSDSLYGPTQYILVNLQAQCSLLLYYIPILFHTVWYLLHMVLMFVKRWKQKLIFH